MERSACVRVCLDCWPDGTLVDTAVQVPLLCVCILFFFLPCACHGCLFCVCCAAARIGLSVSVRSGGVGVSTGVVLRGKERGMSGGGERGETSGGRGKRKEGQD